MSSFEELGVSTHLVQSVSALGYHSPTAIQAQAIPLILEGRDVIGQAQTGTGKTAAFALPLIQRLDTEQCVQILVLTPTRELAGQVADAVKTYGGEPLSRNVSLIYGGLPIGPQIAELKTQPKIVIGTPGRIIDHLQRGTLNIESLRAIVLDEADEMLKMGFRDEVEWVIAQTPKQRQSILFSATMPHEIEEIAERHLNPNQMRVQIRGEGRGSDDVEQQYLLVRRDDKFEALAALLELESQGVALVFVRTRRESTQLVDRLQARGHALEALNGELNQNLRESVVRRLRSGRISAVIATDVAARGLDIDGISLVINHDLPQDVETYIHRIGRTGRAGKSGRAILLVTPRETRHLKRLEEQLTRTLTPITPPSPDLLLKSRAHNLQRQMEEELDTLAARLPKDLEHYQGLLDQLSERGASERDMILAALRLASQSKPLISSQLPPTLPQFDIEELQARRSRAIIAQDGCSIVLLRSGRDRGVRPKDIVGAIAHEAKIDGSLVGAIRIEYTRTLFELPNEHIETVIERLTNKTICGAPARFELWDGQPEETQNSGDSDYRQHNNSDRRDRYNSRNQRKRHHNGHNGHRSELRNGHRSESRNGQKVEIRYQHKSSPQDVGS
jgi:ATP-dependent RNA helicase DeaD